MNSHHAGEQLREESLGVTSEKFLSAHSGEKRNLARSGQRLELGRRPVPSVLALLTAASYSAVAPLGAFEE